MEGYSLSKITNHHLAQQRLFSGVCSLRTHFSGLMQLLWEFIWDYVIIHGNYILAMYLLSSNTSNRTWWGMVSVVSKPLIALEALTTSYYLRFINMRLMIPSKSAMKPEYFFHDAAAPTLFAKTNFSDIKSKVTIECRSQEPYLGTASSERTIVLGPLWDFFEHEVGTESKHGLQMNCKKGLPINSMLLKCSQSTAKCPLRAGSSFYAQSYHLVQ